MENENFLNALWPKYVKDPFGVSGFAFWKITEQIVNADKLEIRDTKNGQIFIAFAKNKLVFYWSTRESAFAIPRNELKELRLLSLHNRYEAIVYDLEETHHIHDYTPLSYDFSSVWNVKRNDAVRIVSLDTTDTSQLSEIAEIINASTNGNMTMETIVSWTKSRVFTPDLWLGAIDSKNGDLIGFGISTYYSLVKETDLDWFYVRNDYQGQGVGKLLVENTISRSLKRSIIIRVAGQADEFYKKCGFESQDKWYYLPRKSTEVAWWE